MKKIDFDWGKAVQGKFDKAKYKKAQKDMKEYEDLIRDSNVTSYGVSMRDGEPFFFVTIEEGQVKDPDKILPDKLGEYEIYYKEGKLRLL